MKVGIILGPGFSLPEAKMYERLKAHQITPIALCPAAEIEKAKSLNMEVRKLTLFGQINMIPLLRELIQFFFPGNFYFIGLNKAVQDLDLIHSVETFNIYTYQAVRSGKPVVLTVWENILFNNEQRFYRNIKALAIQKTKKFIAVTPKTKKVLLLEGASEKKIEVIPPGIDVAHFKPQKKNKNLMQKYNLKEASKNILFMASLIERKGIIDTLNAVHILVKEGFNVNLLIAGSGPLKKKIPSIAKSLGIVSNIRILDFVPYEETPEIYNLCDVFCMPSRPDYTWTEQFGMVFIESMACEKPVVSTWSGSIPEVVTHEETGILVAPGEVIDLANALRKLLKDDSLREKMGKNGRERVIKNYNVTDCIANITKVYREALK